MHRRDYCWLIAEHLPFPGRFGLNNITLLFSVKSIGVVNTKTDSRRIQGVNLSAAETHRVAPSPVSSPHSCGRFLSFLHFKSSQCSEKLSRVCSFTFDFFQVVALIWVATTMMILPRELHDISQTIALHGKVGDEDVIPVFTSTSTSTSTSSSSVLGPTSDFPAPTRRVRPDRNRPRVEIDMDTIVTRMRSFLDELDSKFRNLPDPVCAHVCVCVVSYVVPCCHCFRQRVVYVSTGPECFLCVVRLV